MAGVANELNWLSTNPGALASVLSAIIAASVALMVFALTQYLTRKRERAQFYAPKLETLYALVNDVAEWNASTAKLAYCCADGDEEACKKLVAMDDIELYGHRHAKKIIMCIRLYFPELQSIHQMLFAAQKELNALVFRLHTEERPKLDELIDAAGQVGHFLRLMEAEIVNNRDALIKDRVFWKRFRASTPEEIENPVPRPEGTPFVRSRAGHAPPT